MNRHPTNRPMIGISCRLEKKEEGDWFYLQRDYAEAVYAAGGAPVLIPLIAEEEYTRLLAARLDGVVLSGSGSDVDPARYGVAPHPRMGPVHKEKDAVDAALVGLALETRKPLLGICYGTQALNVALGGTLVQHLDEEPAAIAHPDRQSRHPVRVEPDSMLARLGGRAGEFLVNTSHHQALDRVAPSLRVTARAPDGVIEAVETKEPGRFLVGVQWHPERIWRESELSHALFEELVRAAAVVGDAGRETQAWRGVR